MNAHRSDATRVEVWFDFVCPFSYMGEHRLKVGIAQAGVPVEVVYRSYQLRPDLPPNTDIDFVTMLAERRSLPVSQVKEMMAGATAQAATIGLELRYDRTRVTNTRRAHELAHFANSQGKQAALMERIFKAYFTDGLLISDPATLADLAAEVGLDRETSVRALKEKAFEATVEADIAAARSAGVSSVPHIVIDGQFVISGGQAPEVFADALRQARTSHARNNVG
jgi:predicted DsbA family dithiol-disulfide isomerase